LIALKAGEEGNESHDGEEGNESIDETKMNHLSLKF